MKGSRWVPWLYVGPALLLLAFFLVYPSLDTLRLSFFDRNSDEFIGFANYLWAFTSEAMLIAFRNNILWLVFYTGLTVSLGLVLAVLFDRISYEAAAKSIIFLPMAISFVGAGVIWKFMYGFRPAGEPQICLLYTS